MREYPKIDAAWLVNGLFQDNAGGKNQPYLETLTNMRCDKTGAVGLDPVTQVPAGTVTLWPFPQLCAAEDRQIVFSGTARDGATVGVWDATSTAPVGTNVWQAQAPLSLYATPHSGYPWQFAAMRDLWIAANGSCLVWHLPYDANATGITGAPVACNAVCHNRHRLFLGGLSGSWFNESTSAPWASIMDAWRKTQPHTVMVNEAMSFGANWVVWSERSGGAQDVPYYPLLVMLGAYGTSAFNTLKESLITRIESGELGMAPVRGCGTVCAMAPLGEDVIVYGRTGISELNVDQEGVRYTEKMRHSESVPLGSIIGQGPLTHLVILESGDLTEITPQGTSLTSFRHIFHGRAGLCHYDPTYNEFWIGAGTAGGYIWNGRALSGPHDINPSGMLRRGTVLWMTSKQIPDTLPVVVQTCPFSLSERGSKHVNEMIAECEGITSMQGSIPWRIKSSGAFTNGTAVPFNDNDVAFPHQSAVDAKIRITGSLTGSNPSIGAIGLRFQYEDKRFKRGPSGTSRSGASVEADS